MEEVDFGSMMYFMARTGKTRQHKIINLDWVDGSASSRTMECDEVELFFYEQGNDGNPVPGSKKSGQYVILQNGNVEKWNDPAKSEVVNYDSAF